MPPMPKTTQPASKVRRIGLPEEAVFLELLHTADALARVLVRVLKTRDLSSTQYNVLRILRGAPGGSPALKSPTA